MYFSILLSASSISPSSVPLTSPVSGLAAKLLCALWLHTGVQKELSDGQRVGSAAPYVSTELM